MKKDVVTVSVDNPIIKIEPYYKSFIIHWLIGNTCTSCTTDLFSTKFKG